MVVIEAQDAAAHGFAAVTIAVDTNQAGMFARPFPFDDLLLLLNGPPGIPLVLGVWDCRKEIAAGHDLEAVIRAKLVPSWEPSVEIGGETHVVVAGERRPALTFITGDGPERTGWFGVTVERPGGVVLVGAGVGAGNAASVSADEILTNRAIGAAVRTLEIR
jgi:hypothetical protein